MVITSTRKRQLLAWIGVGSLAVHTAIWAGVPALATLGVVGSLVWVGVSHVLSHSLTKIAKDAQQYAVAEREAAEWQAAQEAHLFERQFRLRQTNRVRSVCISRRLFAMRFAGASCLIIASESK